MKYKLVDLNKENFYDIQSICESYEGYRVDRINVLLGEDIVLGGFSNNDVVDVISKLPRYGNTAYVDTDREELVIEKDSCLLFDKSLLIENKENISMLIPFYNDGVFVTNLELCLDIDFIEDAKLLIFFRQDDSSISKNISNLA